MLYHIVIIMIFAVLAYAVVVLFNKFAIIRKRKKERQSKESELINKLVFEGNLKSGQLSELYDFVEDRTINKEFQERQHSKPRKHDRKDFFMIVDYSVSDRYYRDFIQDISESGVFIKTSQTFSVGQKIQLTFMSPDYQKPFKIKGEIVRVHTDGVGARFIIESQVQESALKSFMSNIQIT